MRTRPCAHMMRNHSRGNLAESMAAGGDRLHSRGTDLAGRVDPSAPDGVVNFNTSYLRHFGNAAAVSSLVV